MQLEATNSIKPPKAFAISHQVGSWDMDRISIEHKYLNGYFSL